MYIVRAWLDTPLWQSLQIRPHNQFNKESLNTHEVGCTLKVPPPETVRDSESP